MQWPLEFPEVFARARGGFDLVAGNPPFLGGKLISGRFGTDYRSFLVKWLAAGRRGHADFVTYFFLRASAIARRFAFIATNTIGQGDTREVGLDALLDATWTIGRAEKGRVWPGAAAIQVAEVWCHRERTAELPILGGQLVPGISPLLVSTSRVFGNPFRLAANARIAFQGSVVLGLGFTISPERARELIEHGSRNQHVLSPYINAEDVCDRPDVSPRRFIINFSDWPEHEARKYPQCYEIVAKLVKPERQRLRPDGSFALRNPLPERWWQYADKRPALYAAIKDLTSVIAVQGSSKFMLPVLLPNGSVFDQKLRIFASSSMNLYGTLTSGLHQSWALRYGSTLGVSPTYSPTDVFENYPLPLQQLDEIGETMQRLHNHRSNLMLSSERGLTASYNRLHSGVDEKEIITLRECHVELDQCTLASYGWLDINLDHGFRETAEGLRFTISESARIEILDRLLELNHARHSEEVAQGVTPSTKGKRAAKGRAKPSPAEEGAQELLEL